MKTADSGQAGFSMIELLVAMVMTLIVSGAIFGLLTGGQNAFRREPELTDRQQNVRIAMDLIKRDVTAAGAGMVPFVQPFTNLADGAGGVPASGYTAGPAAIGNTGTDILEVLTASGGCPSVTLPATPTAAAVTWSAGANDNLPQCFPDVSATPSFFYIGNASTDRGAYGVRMGKADVAAGVAPFNIALVGTANRNPTGGTSAGFCDVIGTTTALGSCTVLFPVDVVRYQIAPDPDDATLPSLWRSRTGQFNNAGNNIGGPAVGAGNWEVVARGIEDLQVEYFRNGAWANTAGDVYCDGPCTNPVAADFNRLVRQVRVTLSARATGKSRIQGARTSGVAPTAIRGQLQAVITPRAALTALTLNTGAPGWY